MTTRQNGRVSAPTAAAPGASDAATLPVNLGRVPLRSLLSRHGLMVLAFLVLWSAFLEQRSLWDPDEGRYAEIPREMAASGDWITPRLNDLLYFEKPPLQYWATAGAYRVFGEHNWTARLWSALAGLAGALFAFYACRRLYSQRAGMYAALTLASSILYFGVTHLNTLDAGLSFFLEVTVFSLAIGLREETPERERKWWIRAAWAAAGLAVLSKGLVGLVLPAAALVVYAVLYRDRSIWRRLAPLTGPAIFLLVSAPWFVAVSRANPDFLQFFFVHEHYTRFLTTEHHRGQPWWFFFPVLAAGALPWVGPMLCGWWRALRVSRGGGFKPFTFLAVWALVVLGFFSASGSKLVTYILPVLPALAVLAARYMCEAAPGRVARQVFWGAVGPAAAFAGMASALALRPGAFGAAMSEALPLWCLAAAGLWGVAAFLARRLADPRKFDATMIVLGLTLFAVHQLVLLGSEAASPYRTTAALARQIKPLLSESTRVYAVRMYPQTLPVYLGRPVTLVEFRGELDFGLQREPHKTLPTLDAFRDAWSRETDAVAIMASKTYDTLLAAGTPMTVIAADAERTVVRRH
jgi:4-amino-4-deoxy-L-arabinose transferase-like glycosyltransferase